MNKFKDWTLQQFEDYNAQYDRGDFRGSEAIKYDIDAIKKWINIRDSLTLTEDYSGTWQYIRIVQKETRTKYSTKYIFVDMDKKVWRTCTTGSEFYNGPQCEEYKEN